ncbi:LysM peptidoglycan-binding domain-containing protein [Moraxella sp. VT-16-12]|uniref:LysM peptidoglycan-binding domain-containing protein n=1 Tax=Moraxella sp. VT-16-12 TaxID=2014877 RepID=UPI000B7EF48B|nr:LysM peptidoglycan-binding domain-containing protein [Moraxella sp. VT-16-12]TWV81981.1 LysM peptidoglycan-binding domain-containing protein [Moraxella sp. VT-16-12]
MKLSSKDNQCGILKPLAVSVSSCLLFACASTPSHMTANTNTVAIPTKTDVPVTPDIVPSQDDFTGVLDQATLDELEDLLFATDMSMVEGDRLTVQRYGNLWDRVRLGYRMNHVQNRRVEAQKSWFYSRQDYLNRLTARTSRYLYYTVTEAERRGIPTELALLPIIESSYDPSATSNAAAAGLWQFIPSTGRIYGLNQSTTYDGRRDIIESTRAAYDFLTSLYNQFGSWELALAAYNAGPGRVSRAISANRNAGLPTDYWSLRLPTETMNYVPRFMAVAQIVKSPESYGVSLPAIANHTHFRTVPTNFGVSLYDISQTTGVPLDELRLLNPALISFNVDSAGPGRVVIPNSLPISVDRKITDLKGYGYGASAYVASQYVAPKNTAIQNINSARALASVNALPTTSAQVTAKNTIVQEPALTSEERDFIAAQIQAHTADNVQPISDDGNIELTALQTGQSVLEARGETKSLSFNAPSTATASDVAPKTQPSDKPSNTQVSTVQSPPPPPSNTTIPATTQTKPKPTPAPAKVERYKVVAGDTLIGIANKHGLTVGQLASYNGISTNAQVINGQRLWLVPGKVSTVTSSNTAPIAKTTTHTVQAGESLTSIARKYNTTVQDVAALNGLSVTDGVLIDQKLKVPASIKPVATNTPKTTAPQQPKTESTVKYTIASGDSLTSVAAKYNVSIEALAAANNMSSDAGLVRGKTLIIPTKGTKTEPKKAEPKNVQKTPTQTTPVKKDDPKPDVAQGKVFKSTENYTVQSGDTLIGLAKKHGVSVNDLAATNSLATNAQLKRGQVIKLPKLTDTHVVKSGESLTSIAKKHGISVAELAKMNQIEPTTTLKIGQKITVPAN